jgi:hypothetical protein
MVASPTELTHYGGGEPTFHAIPADQFSPSRHLPLHSRIPSRAELPYFCARQRLSKRQRTNRACLGNLTRRCFKVRVIQQCGTVAFQIRDILHPWSREATLRETKKTLS